MLPEILDKYETVIGLEVHAQLLTKSKAYCGDSTEYGLLPNTQLSVLTLAHPGTLPRFNKKVAEFAVRMGIACNCKINHFNIFDRKNYFYPDLPKGYQITQDKTPICYGGYIDIRTKSAKKRIGITRIHMEEDAGKSIHIAGNDESFVDFNRAGVPLIEIVSEPEIRSQEEAYAYLQEVKKLLMYLDICDGNMEEGSLRADLNISVRIKGETVYGKKVEIKNMNSFRNVQRAIEFETIRQISALENGEKIAGETRNFDATDGKTYSMRTKEGLNDYRYFPEPDLQPFVINQSYINDIANNMPPLPNKLFERFTAKFGLPEYDATVLTDNKEFALYFDELCSLTTHYKSASNWLMGPVRSLLNERALSLHEFPLRPSKMLEIIDLVESGKVNFAIAAQRVFPELVANPASSALEIAQKLNLIQDSSEDYLIPIIKDVLKMYPDKVSNYKAGNKNMLKLFMGEVMKLSKGKADPKKATELIEIELES
jgi:aspartyl-tRNA(Asn)/glutamyl-tRNA(Gln) amidotransferase subunit B